MEINCLICGDVLKIRRHNVFTAVSDHSGTMLLELIQKALGFELDLGVFDCDSEKDCVCLCESCFGKINNYDLGLTLSGKAQRELEQLLEEKIRKQDSIDNVMKREPTSSNRIYEDFEPVKQEPDIVETYESEMEEEHLIEYEEEIFDVDQVEIQLSSESDGEIVREPPEIKVPRPRGRKFTRAVEKGRFYCNICNAGYTTQEALDFHAEKHKNIPSNECPECHKKFAQKSALSRHMPMHTGKKPFLNHKQESRHLKFFVSGEKPYQCQQCGKRFIHYSSFNMHMLIHDDVRLKKCKICGLALRSSSHLSRHMRVHTGKTKVNQILGQMFNFYLAFPGEKPYTCPTCGQKFAQRYNMNAHMKGHQGIKRVPSKATQCPLCDVSFRAKLKLKEHINEVHGQTVAIVEPSHEDSENGEGWVIIKEDFPQKLSDGLKVEGVALLS